jgi:hypothetical protein
MAAFGDQIISQSVYFCYYLLDLAHAAGQPPSAARAVESQIDQHPSVARALQSRQIPTH